MSKIRLDRVTTKNYKEAIALQKEIFPEEDGSTNIKASVFKDIFNRTSAKYLESMEYFICRDENGKGVGTTGCYVQKGMPEDGWVGWYGVSESARGMGYGKEILQQTMDYMKEKGFENCRLYTDPNDNAAACVLYRKMGMLEEVYTAEDVKDVTLFSLNLHGKETTPIGKTNLNLKPRLEGYVTKDEPAKTTDINPAIIAKVKGHSGNA